MADNDWNLKIRHDGRRFVKIRYGGFFLLVLRPKLSWFLKNRATTPFNQFQVYGIADFVIYAQKRHLKPLSNENIPSKLNFTGDFLLLRPTIKYFWNIRLSTMIHAPKTQKQKPTRYFALSVSFFRKFTSRCSTMCSMVQEFSLRST